MNIYPAIDIRKGRAVRLSQGQAGQETVYYEDPAKPARMWKDAGAQWVHVVDLDGAFTGAPANLGAVRKIAETGLKIQFGGGLRTEETAARAFEAGASRIVIGTKAADDTLFIGRLVSLYGEKIAAGIDAKDGRAAVRGWVDDAGISALDMALQAECMGIQTIIYTDIGRDGMLAGPNFAGQRRMLEALSVNLIASGGVSSAADIGTFLGIRKDHKNLSGVIIGKALYEGRIDLAALFASPDLE